MEIPVNMPSRCWLFVLVLACAAASGQTGTAVPSLAPFDQLMSNLMTKYQIPGGSIAVTQNGRLVLARGYGYADQENQVAVQPDSLFRIASLSKAITAVAVMHLVEQGKLSLDQPAFSFLRDVQPPAGATIDPRLGSTTVRHLLEHAGGWDSTQGFDPMFYSPQIVKELGVPAPASTEDIIRYMRGQPLQFDPGTRYVYSNFDYAVLGRIIERITGMSYEQYVRTSVLALMGITKMRIGNTLLQGRLPGEVKYYAAGNTASRFPDTPAAVPWCYGGWYLEAMDAHGGWVASAIDYAKFLNAIDGRRGRSYLSPASVAAMTGRPSVPAWAGSSYWYGFGVWVRPSGNDANWWHSGSLDGTITYQIRTYHGFVWVVCFNTRPATWTDLTNDIDSGLWRAWLQVTAWPSNDQFVNYPDADAQAGVAQPAITTREGVVNGATFNRGVVSGSWISLLGVSLSPTTRIWRGDDIVGGKLPTSLDGVRVKINGQPAYVYYISPTQINAQAPEGLPAAWIPVEAINNGVSSGTVLTHAVQNAPGALTYSIGSRTFAVATGPGGTIIGDPAVAPGTRNAAPRETITIYASGIAPSPAGVVISAPQPVRGLEVTLGGQPAAVSFAGIVSPGLFQINAIVPDLPDGDQPLLLKINGAQSPAGVIIPVHRSET